MKIEHFYFKNFYMMIVRNLVNIMKMYDILISQDIINSINNNLVYITELIPEIKAMMGFDHMHPHHHLDVWNHTLLALSNSEPNFDIRLSLLLHDIGKPFSYQQEGNIRHFKGHPNKSAEISFNILKRLGFNEKYINKICFYIEYHDTPIDNYLIMNDYETALCLYKIQESDALAHNPNKLEKRKKYLKEIEEKLNNKFKSKIC